MSSDQWGSNPWGREQQDPQVPSQYAPSPQYTPPAEYALQTPIPLGEGAQQGRGGLWGQQGQQPQGQRGQRGQQTQQGQVQQGQGSLGHGQRPVPQPQSHAVAYGAPQAQPMPEPPPQPMAQGHGYEGAGERRPRRNGVAVAGLLTCFLPLVGLVLSIAGAAKARVAVAGRGVAQAGIVLSLLFTLLWGGAGYYYFEVRSPNAGDAGCVNADADYLRFAPLLEQDAAVMTKGTAGSVAFTFAVKKYQSDLSGLISSFGADAQKAGHSEVRTAIQVVSGDLAQLDIELGNLAAGNYPGAVHLMDLDSKLMTDFQHLESLCNSASVG